MLSIRETIDKTTSQWRKIKSVMDAWGSYHPDRASLTEGLNAEDTHLVQQTIHNAPLKEFLAKSGTAGIAGAAYLIPVKVHDMLISFSRVTDIVPLIGQVVSGWNGGDLDVPISHDHTYTAEEFMSGGQLPDETLEVMKPTITPISFGINARITNDLIEDAQYSMVEQHIQRAAFAMGLKASDLALTVLKAATDGWGTRNNGLTGDADETKLVGGGTNDVVGCIRDLGDDLCLANTLVTTPEAWGHSISTQASEVGWQAFPGENGYHLKISELDILKSTSAQLHDSADVFEAPFTACVTLIFDRNNALLTGRKRWLQINNYADPRRDLAGATITARQDSVTLFDDSIYILTET